MPVREAAHGKWDYILSEFGVNTETRKNGPCPVCGGKDRFRYAGDSWGKWVCTHCTDGKYSHGMELALAIDGRPFKAVAERVEGLAGKSRPVEIRRNDPVPRLRAMWRKVRPAGEEVRGYLAGRGLECPSTLLQANLTYFEDGKAEGVYPAMVAKVEDSEGPTTLHVTYLLPSGKKRKVMPPKRPASAVYVRLYDAIDVLGIAEGIETAIAAHMAFQVPLWACLNAHSLERFTPPAGIRKLIVFGDADKTYTGQAAAYSVAHRLRDTVEVEVRLPESGDWADALGQHYSASQNAPERWIN